jgi:hypothetical protein
MREQHDTRMLEEMVKSVSDKICTPTILVNKASDRRTREIEASTGATTKAAEAQARKTVLLAEGRKAFAVLAALSLVVVALGLAGRMILSAIPEQIIETRLVPAPPGPTSAPIKAPAFVPAAIPAEAGVITTNFTLFREKTVKLGAREYDVVAGHEFASETDTMFSHAWCYTNALEEGLTLKIGLGTQEPNKSALMAMPTAAMLKKSGLSCKNIQMLYNNCPWLDGNPNVQASVGEAAAYQFNAEVTSDSIDELIAAVASGTSVVEFSSPGGLVDEAIRGFTAIRAAGVKTVATGDCVSACALLFLGGSERSVAMSGKIGVHQWSTEDGMTYDFDAQLTSASLISLIASAGVSEEFYIAGARTPASQIYYLTRAELSNWGVVGHAL